MFLSLATITQKERSCLHNNWRDLWFTRSSLTLLHIPLTMVSLNCLLSSISIHPIPPLFINLSRTPRKKNRVAPISHPSLSQLTNLKAHTQQYGILPRGRGMEVSQASIQTTPHRSLPYLPTRPSSYSLPWLRQRPPLFLLRRPILFPFLFFFVFLLSFLRRRRRPTFSRS